MSASRKAAAQQIWPPCGYEQAEKEFPYGLHKAPHYRSAYSFICLLIKCARPPPSPSVLSSFSHLFPLFPPCHKYPKQQLYFTGRYEVWWNMCMINPSWRKYLQSCQTSPGLWLNGVNVLTVEMTRATSGLMTTSVPHHRSQQLDTTPICVSV